MRAEQVDGAAEIGLPHVARRARAAIDHGRADGGAGEEGCRVVGGVVGIAKGNTVEGDVELPILKPAQGGDAGIADAAAVGAKGGDRRRDHHRGGIVTALGGRLLDELVGDQRLGLGFEDRGLRRRGNGGRVGLGRHHDGRHVGALGTGSAGASRGSGVREGRRGVAERQRGGAKQGSESVHCGGSPNVCGRGLWAGHDTSVTATKVRQFKAVGETDAAHRRRHCPGAAQRRSEYSH